MSIFWDVFCNSWKTFKKKDIKECLNITWKILFRKTLRSYLVDFFAPVQLFLSFCFITGSTCVIILTYFPLVCAVMPSYQNWYDKLRDVILVFNFSEQRYHFYTCFCSSRIRVSKVGKWKWSQNNFLFT